MSVETIELIVEFPKSTYNSTPEMKQASELIRCKDCKKYGTKFCALDIWTDTITIYKAQDNDFCSYAERKEEVEQGSDVIFNKALDVLKEWTPEPCKTCPTNPKNGGNGICNCILGTPKIT